MNRVRKIGEMVNKFFKKSHVYVVFATCILSGVNLTHCCSIQARKKLENLIENKRYIDIYNAINNYKIALFASDDLIVTGIPAEGSNEEKQWQSIIACSNALIRNIKDKSSEELLLYNKYISELEKVDLFVRANIRDLHDKYASNGLKKNYLEIIKNRVERNIEKIKNYYNYAYFNLVSKFPVAELKKDLKILFPGYDVFFKTYTAWKESENAYAEKNDTIFNLTTDKIIAFLNYSRVLYIPKNEQGTVLGQDKAKNLFDKLGKVIGKLQNQISEQQNRVKSSWFFKQREEETLKQLTENNIPMITDSKQVMYALLATYLSDKIPDEFFMRIYNTKDVPSLIIFAEAGSLQEVLQSLLRSINKHLSK